MDTSTIELLLASAISKKRKVDEKNAATLAGAGDDDGTDSLYSSNTTILDLTSRKDVECEVLANFLKSNNRSNKYTVTELILSKVGIGPRGGVLLAEPLSTNQTIVHLDLERNGLSAIGACAIFKALATNTTIRKLNMSLNDVKAATSKGNDEATRALGDALQNNSTLTDLLLVRSGLGPKGGTNLAEGLTNSTSLLRLDLVGNDIMADGGQAIGEALKTNTTLRDLNLRWNRIGCGGDRGILSLADALRANASLQRLDMSVNELYSEGAIAFGKALGVNQSLIDLSLERNEIGVAGAIAIGEAFEFNTTLERLVLSGNPMIGDEGAAAIGQSLQLGQSALKILEMVGCGVGVKGATAFGQALQQKSLPLSTLRLERNKLSPEGVVAIASGLGDNTSLRHLNLSKNGMQGKGGRALALALRKNTTLCTLDVSSNDIDVDNTTDTSASDARSLHIVEAIVDHPALKDVDISSNALEIVPIDCQLKLAKLLGSGREVNIDLLDNPLSSPPLGRRAGVEGLKAYLNMLLSDSTAVNRIRLMVLGFGGVGKSTFCDAVTQPKDSLPFFHSSLVPLEKWDFGMIASWARRLGTHWAPSIGNLLESHKISGQDLMKLTILQDTNGNETYEPSNMLNALLNANEANGLTLSPTELKSFSRAIGSLMRKGYFSTVGAVKLEGLLELEPSKGDTGSSGHEESDVDDEIRSRRACSLVDFAGQMEYLVSHQLLLSSLHTLCVVLQPAPSFGNPQNRHNGSWMYWSRFLRALGDRRRGSLLLAISQQDKLGLDESADAAIETELDAIRSVIPNISDSPPLSLDYRSEFIQKTVQDVRKALSGAAEVVARDWWVPASYEKLAELVRKMEEEKKSNKEVPIISRKELHHQLPSEGLHKMHDDPQLFQRGIEYLEAVGDVMTDQRLDCLLLDPISWFASFLAHFIRDDDIVTSVQLESRFVQRGVVSLEDVVSALQHEYTKPREQVVQIMSLVCRLELCIRYEKNHGEGTKDCEDSNEDALSHPASDEESAVTYLFPCLLPMVSASELTPHWPGMQNAQNHLQQSMPLVYRGYRFRSRNGFFPPGLFPGLLARCRLLRSGVLCPERMWKNCAVLVFGEHTRAMLRIDLCEGENAILDVVGVAPTAEELFVGAAKGQASVVIWMTHLVKMFLRRSYPQLETDEFFLSPFAECHEIPQEIDIETEAFHPCQSYFHGTEFAATPKSGKQYKGDHCCEADGCWSQLGVGHKTEAMKPQATTEYGLFCNIVKKVVHFELRT